MFCLDCAFDDRCNFVFLLSYQTYILDDVCCKVMTDRVYLKVIVRSEIDGLHTRTKTDGLHTISLYVLYFVPKTDTFVLITIIILLICSYICKLFQIPFISNFIRLLHPCLH